MKTRFHVPHIQILQCRYCLVQWPREWPRDASFKADFWRIYYHPESDVALRGHSGQVVIPAGRLALIPPQSNYVSDMTNGFRQFYIHFISSRPYADYPPGIYIMPCEMPESMMIGELMALLEDSPEVLPVTAGMRIMSLILRLLLKLPEHSGAPISRAAEETRLYIDKNFQRNLSNTELARRVGMATNSFARLFRGEMGMTVQHYIRQQRTRQAALLLRYSTHSLSEIAEMCGFGNRYYFTRVFTADKGLPPAEFRRQAKIQF